MNAWFSVHSPNSSSHLSFRYFLEVLFTSQPFEPEKENVAGTVDFMKRWTDLSVCVCGILKICMTVYSWGWPVSLHVCTNSCSSLESNVKLKRNGIFNSHVLSFHHRNCDKPFCYRSDDSICKVTDGTTSSVIAASLLCWSAIAFFNVFHASTRALNAFMPAAWPVFYWPGLLCSLCINVHLHFQQHHFKRRMVSKQV